MDDHGTEERDNNQTEEGANERHYGPTVDQPCDDSRRVKINPSKMEKKQLATLLLLSWSNFCCGALLALYGPFFPQPAESKGMSTTIYGLVFGTYWLVITLSIPLFAIIVCAVPAKLVNWIGVLVMGICGVLFGLLDMCPAGIAFNSLAFSIRIVEGFAVTATKTSMNYLLISQFKENIFSILLSVETFFALGLILSSIIGGALVNPIGFSLPFYIAGTFTVISAICSAIMLPEPDECRKADMKILRELLKQPEMYMYLFIDFTALAYTGSLLTTLEPHIRQLHISWVYLGMIFAIPVFMYLLSATTWGWLIQRGMNNLFLAVIASFAIIASLLLIAPIPFSYGEPSLAFVILALFLKGIGTSGKLIGSYHGSFKDIIGKGFPDDDSTYRPIIGIHAVGVAFGACIGTSVAGSVYDRVGFATGALILLGLEVFLVVVAFIFSFVRNYRRPKRQLSAAERQPILPHHTTEDVTDR